MKLSERMILGATLIKHVPRASGDGEGCAIQCAVQANAEDTTDMDWIHNRTHVGGCPARCNRMWTQSTVGGIIVHLNDDHKWSIDRIAQWVASVEPQEQPTLCESMGRVQRALDIGLARTEKHFERMEESYWDSRANTR